jgi:hypothetical protein
MTARKHRTGDKEKEKALAVRLHARRGESGDWDDTPIEARVQPQRAVVTSLRLPVEEFVAVQSAAKSAGQTVSDFIRSAIATKLHGVSHVTVMHVAAGSSEGRSQATVLVPTLEGGHTHNPGPDRMDKLLVVPLLANFTG